MNKVVLASIAAAALGVAIGRATLASRIGALEARAQRAERARDRANEGVADAVTSVGRGLAASRAERGAPPFSLPATTSPSTPQSPADEMAALMSRMQELAEKADFGGVTAADSTAVHEEAAHKVRDDFVAKAGLDATQQAAIDPLVTKLDATLEEPLARLAALEDADHYAVSEWSQARVDVYQAVAAAEQSLRAQLSPQQREQLDRTEFSLVSQLGTARYEAIVGRGLFSPVEVTTIEESPPK